jgi:hypothetical protein
MTSNLAGKVRNGGQGSGGFCFGGQQQPKKVIATSIVQNDVSNTTTMSAAFSPSQRMELLAGREMTFFLFDRFFIFIPKITKPKSAARIDAETEPRATYHHYPLPPPPPALAHTQIQTNSIHNVLVHHDGTVILTTSSIIQPTAIFLFVYCH